VADCDAAEVTSSRNIQLEEPHGAICAAFLLRRLLQLEWGSASIYLQDSSGNWPGDTHSFDTRGHFHLQERLNVGVFDVIASRELQPLMHRSSKFLSVKQLLLLAFAFVFVARNHAQPAPQIQKEASKHPARSATKKDEPAEAVSGVISTAGAVTPITPEVVTHDPEEVTRQVATFNENRDLNKLVLEVIRGLPRGGVYKADAEALAALNSAIQIDTGRLCLAPEVATPSFCSGATYLVFLSVIQRLANENGVEIPKTVLEGLLPDNLRDGVGVWGRWNANGPGTARLFDALRLGRNFTSFDDARAGDFMKIFWNENIGNQEHGHSVIYFGKYVTKEGVETVRFWSSNQPYGYFARDVPKFEIKRAVFSRLERPSGIFGVGSLPRADDFLASMQKRSCTEEEMLRSLKLPTEHLLAVESTTKEALVSKPIQIGAKLRTMRHNQAEKKRTGK
jgi:hypothetical protein